MLIFLYHVFQDNVCVKSIQIHPGLRNPVLQAAPLPPTLLVLRNGVTILVKCRRAAAKLKLKWSWPDKVYRASSVWSSWLVESTWQLTSALMGFVDLAPKKGGSTEVRPKVVLKLQRINSHLFFQGSNIVYVHSHLPSVNSCIAFPFLSSMCLSFMYLANGRLLEGFRPIDEVALV